MLIFSQPTLSRRIALLERGVRAQVFVRHQRRVSLTPSGHLLGCLEEIVKRQIRSGKWKAALLRFFKRFRSPLPCGGSLVYPALAVELVDRPAATDRRRATVTAAA